MMVGPEAEKTGLVRHCSRLFVTGANLTVPFFTIVLRKMYGLGGQAMAGGSTKAPMFTVAWPTGEFGGMGLEGFVKLGFRNELAAVEDPAERKELFEQMVARAYEHGKAVNTASHFEIDDVIDPADSRAWITASPAVGAAARRRARARSGRTSTPGDGGTQMTTSRIRELAERHWNGEGDLVHAHHPVMPVERREAEELLDGVLYVKSVASITAIDTGDGLVLLDTGGPFDAQHIFDVVRAWRPGGEGRGRLAAAVFSHHHIDHVFGTGLFQAEAAAEGWPSPTVYGHEDMPADFHRYRRTVGWNTAINQRQFGLPVSAWEFPSDFRDPDVTYREQLTFRQGDLAFELHHSLRRDRRRHVDLAARPQDPACRRPVHLGRAQRRQPAEGPALRRGVGGRAARDGGAGCRGHAGRARAADLRSPTASARR